MRQCDSKTLNQNHVQQQLQVNAYGLRCVPTATSSFPKPCAQEPQSPRGTDEFIVINDDGTEEAQAQPRHDNLQFIDSDSDIEFMGPVPPAATAVVAPTIVHTVATAIDVAQVPAELTTKVAEQVLADLTHVPAELMTKVERVPAELTTQVPAELTTKVEESFADDVVMTDVALQVDQTDPDPPNQIAGQEGDSSVDCGLEAPAAELLPTNMFVKVWYLRGLRMFHHCHNTTQLTRR